MAFADCLGNAVAGGALRQDRADAAQAQFEKLRADNIRLGMDDAMASAAALQMLKDTVMALARKRYHAVLQQLRVANEIGAHMDSVAHPDLMLEALLEPSARSGYTGLSVRTLSQSYFRHASALMRDALDSYHTTVSGTITNRMSFLNMVREAHGVATGDAMAKKAAEGYRAAKEFLRQAFNEYGGDIGFLEGHGMAHSHDRIKLLSAGFERWALDIMPLLDWARIKNFQTGRAFATTGGKPNKAAVLALLKDIYDGITTKGADTREPSFSSHGSALYNQRADHRVLHFAGDGWLTYNDKYGTSDAFSAMLNGLQGLANDVAQMRVLGPSPRAGLEFAVQSAEKRAAALMQADPKAGAVMMDKVRMAATRARAQLSIVTGEANIPHSVGWAKFFSGTRQWLVAAQLGRAVLAAPSDMITTSTAALVAGMNPVNTLARVVKLLVSPAERQRALQMGHMLDAMMEAGGGASRWWGEQVFTGFAQKAAHIQMRASGLSFWTDMVRTAVRMEHGATLARNAHLALDDLPRQLKASLTRTGISAADWDALRDPAHHFVAPNGARFISPFYWLESKALPDDPGRLAAQDLAMRLAAGLEDEVEASVPTASLKGRAKLNGGRPGTIMGEASRSMVMYRPYSLSLMFKQFDQLSRIPGAGWKAGFIGGTIGGLTAMGALSIQLKEIAKGNDPRPMNDWKFWAAAMVQGGGIGIFGDFFAASTSRIGAGPLGTLSGPVASTAADVATTFGSDVAALATGKPTHFGRHLVDMERKYTPVLSSLWYAALPWDRTVSDTLQKWLDPEAAQAWRAAEKKKAKDYGNRPWWPHGTPVPPRAPNLAAIAGAGP